MRYKLLKDLPFADKGSIFETGSWVGGGWGVDQGKTHYEGGGSSSNGVRTFTEPEDKVIDTILNDKKWIKQLPHEHREEEAFSLYDEGRFSQEELIEFIKKS